MLPRISIFFVVFLAIYFSQCTVHSAIVSYENQKSANITDDNWLIEQTIYVTGLNPSLSSNANISLQIWLTHTRNSDLQIRLYGPDDSQVVITQGRGGRYDNVFNGTLFSDSALNSVASYAFSQNGVVSPLQPEQPFSTFIGKNPNGQWKLSISDLGFGEDGKLDKFRLNIQGKMINNSFNIYKSK